MQILAASVEIPMLRERLGCIQVNTHRALVDFIDRAQMAINNGQIRASSDALAMIIETYSMGAIMTDLHTEAGLDVSAEDFRKLMEGMLENAFSSATPPSLD
jgi:hypothetical protein